MATVNFTETPCVGDRVALTFDDRNSWCHALVRYSYIDCSENIRKPKDLVTFEFGDGSQSMRVAP